jgi:GNAT superfamily N-acetyltransferase
LKVFNKAHTRYRDGILMNVFYQRMHLNKTGIIPFYLVEEGLFGKPPLSIKPKVDPLEVVELGPSDMAAIAAKRERIDHSEKEMLEMLSKGCICLGLKHQGQIAALMWYDLRQCSYEHLKFDLKADEAYLYSARTFKAYRGKALAPYLRQKMYEHLASRGRTRLYSITLYENTPSLMFKKKLNARNVRLYLRIQLFRKNLFTFLVKKFN